MMINFIKKEEAMTRAIHLQNLEVNLDQIYLNTFTLQLCLIQH